MTTASDVLAWLGRTDVYVLDQWMRGRIRPAMRLLDAGCGTGRNLPYFLRAGFDVSAVDAHPDAVDRVRKLAAKLAPRLPASNFRAERIEAMSFPDASFDAVFSSAVLHFAEGPADFRGMLDGMWRVLRSGGFFFARLASTITIEDAVAPIGNGRYRLPDGTDRFLVDEAMLESLAEELGGMFAEPLKTTNVQRQRAMTTWCLTKR